VVQERERDGNLGRNREGCVAFDMEVFHQWSDQIFVGMSGREIVTIAQSNAETE